MALQTRVEVVAEFKNLVPYNESGRLNRKIRKGGIIDMALDKMGNLFIVNDYTGLLSKIDVYGNVKSLAHFFLKTGKGQFASVVVDDDGTIYIATRDDGGIHMWISGVLSTLCLHEIDRNN